MKGKNPDVLYQSSMTKWVVKCCQFSATNMIWTLAFLFSKKAEANLSKPVPFEAPKTRQVWYQNSELLYRTFLAYGAYEPDTLHIVHSGSVSGFQRLNSYQSVEIVPGDCSAGEVFAQKNNMQRWITQLCTEKMVSWKKIGRFSVLGVIRIFWTKYAFLRQSEFSHFSKT